MPDHRIFHELGMGRDKFMFMWRHFHVSEPEESDIHTESDEIENNDGEEDLLETRIERIVQDQEMLQEENEEEDGSSQKDSNEDNNEKKKKDDKEHWFKKIKPFINHFRDESYDLIFVLGTCLSMDEMMIQFMGRSYETHCIKNKPIGEGYKMFVLTTYREFVVFLTPDGRTEKSGKNEFKANKEEGKIRSMVKHCVEVIQKLKKKQLERIKNAYNRGAAT